MKKRTWLRVGGGCCVGIAAVAAVVAFHGNVDSNKKMPVAVEKTIAPTES